MTRVALPEMEREGYHSSLATGVIAAGGTLGIMIPPSAVFALYGIITEQNISKLFIAGILPGILGIVFYAVAVQTVGFLRPKHVPCSPRESWQTRFRTLFDVWAVLVLFSFVIGGIYGGIFTVTEAAGVGAAGTWVIGAVRRRLDLKATVECLIEALRITSAIFAIVIGALIFGYFLAITQTTQNLSFWITSLPLGPYGILAVILLAYFVLGAVMDELAITLLTLPIVFPIIVQLGFDPIWFGVIFVMTVTLGMNTPPVGMNVFVINSIARHVPLTDIYKGVAPFIAADLLRLVILVAVPLISLLLPMTMK
jgi:tripartite ATP-independent transporter DctM subunit